MLLLREFVLSIINELFEKIGLTRCHQKVVEVGLLASECYVGNYGNRCENTNRNASGEGGNFNLLGFLVVHDGSFQEVGVTIPLVKTAKFIGKFPPRFFWDFEPGKNVGNVKPNGL